MDDSVDDLPHYRAPRRVSTSPMPRRDSVSSDTPDKDLVETLYSHPNIKIISFTATGRAFARSPATSNVDPPGTLSWSSQLERTIAVGPFRIYRAPRSVAFLSCGSALQPILRKSQCWCIDEVNSKFILQIRRPNYWRIELPVEDLEDQQRAEELREVLDKILQFEKTECPFKRTFTVDLPEQVPVTILPWTPRAQPTMPDDAAVPSTSSRRSSFAGRATTPTPLSDKLPMDFPSSPLVGRPTRAASCVVPSNISIYEEYGMHLDPLQPTGGNNTSESSTRPLDVVPERPAEHISSYPFLSSLPESYSSPSFASDSGAHHDGSSVFSTSPTQSDLFYDDKISHDAATLNVNSGQDYDCSFCIKRSGHKKRVRNVKETFGTPTNQPRLQRRDSEESFHSVESWHSSGAPLHPSPPTSQAESAVDAKYESNETDTLSVERCKRDKSSRSRGSSPMPCAWESDPDSDDSESSSESAKAAIKDTIDVETKTPSSTATPPQRPFITRHRATTSSLSVRRRALSPLPPAANLFTPASTMERRPYKSRLETVKNLPMAIIAKTCEMIMGPPSSLIRLILRVAARIASGQWRGLVYGYGEDGEEIPVQWDYSEGEFSDWSDDENYQHDHRSGQGKRHSRHRSRNDSITKETAAQKELHRRPSSSDDSRSWGVD
ncbi:hypothetical protein HG531_005047 [Fusarium graminearum]|nr:hypothetical protein HG531_005047 [Fusarium graminearum]